MAGSRLYTLVFVRGGDSVLLGMKKRGFGVGRWNGFGGKVEAGETTRAAAARELLEEAGLEVGARDLAYRGHLRFEFDCHAEPMVVKVFAARRDAVVGEPTETEEMRPRWFAVDELPFESMWPDDRLWFPHLLAGDCFSGEFLFEGHDRIVEHALRRVEPERLEPIDGRS